MKRIINLFFIFCILDFLFAQNQVESILDDKEINFMFFEYSLEKRKNINENEKLTFQIKISEDAEYVMLFDYLIPEDIQDSAIKIIIDKNYFTSQKLLKNDEYDRIPANNSIFLHKGKHTVDLYCVFGKFSIDKILFVPINDVLRKKIAPPMELCIKSPSSATKELYENLCSLRGHGILSGQQIYNDDLSPITAINSVTNGKNPAILGIDLINYSPSRVERGVSAGRTIESAIDWNNKGGIVTCCWHWNAPANLLDVDEKNKHWYEGFVTGSNTFDFPKGLDDDTSVEYSLLLRDIDVIAEQLKILQESGVPVLWRPLHEASGGWFWWGTKKADYYIKLYKLIFHRLVDYHQLNNLIWVWNGQSPTWYPGDEYVDVISYDDYSGENRHSTVEVSLSLIQSATSQAKLCAISENGALPNIDKLAEVKSVWSWFCTWNGDFVVEYNTLNYSDKFTSKKLFSRWYDTNWLITREEYVAFCEERCKR